MLKQVQVAKVYSLWETVFKPENCVYSGKPYSCLEHIFNTTFEALLKKNRLKLSFHLLLYFYIIFLLDKVAHLFSWWQM